MAATVPLFFGLIYYLSAVMSTSSTVPEIRPVLLSMLSPCRKRADGDGRRAGRGVATAEYVYGVIYVFGSCALFRRGLAMFGAFCQELAGDTLAVDGQAA